MCAQSYMSTPTVLRQRLLTEFAGLQDACPQGVYMSVSPGDPTLWNGTMFIQNGPYASAIMRLQITFPSQYPTIPPTVTLLTDMFHPLVTPLTTYMYSTDIQEGGTVSATDDERLPPGGFSLRHGFPKWFGRGSRSAASSRQVSAQHRTTDADTIHGQDTPGRRATVSPKHIIPPTRPTIPYGHSISIYEILKYLRSAFDNEGILDSIPLEAAGNPGAWHAWRAHQISLGRTLPPAPDTPEASDEQSDTDISSSAPEGYHRVQGGLSPRSPARKPREWNWEGVWEVRARRDIEKSVADSTLYGGTMNNDEMIRFINADDEHVEEMKAKARQYTGRV